MLKGIEGRCQGPAVNDRQPELSFLQEKTIQGVRIKGGPVFTLIYPTEH